MKAVLRWCCCCCQDDISETDEKGLLPVDAPPTVALKNDELYSIRKISSFHHAESKEDLAKSLGDLSGAGESVNVHQKEGWNGSLDANIEEPKELVLPSPAGKHKVPWHNALLMLKQKHKGKDPHKNMSPELTLSSPNLVAQVDDLKVPHRNIGGSSSCLPSSIFIESNKMVGVYQQTQWTHSHSQSIEDMDREGEECSTPLADDVFLGKEDETDGFAKSFGIDRSIYPSSPITEVEPPLKSKRNSPSHSPERPVNNEDFQDLLYGTITFSAFYNQKKRKLGIEVHKVENLPPKGKNNIYDVVVRLSLLPSDKQAKTSQILRGSLSPMVEEDFLFNVKEPMGKVVRLSVFNAYQQGKNDAVGHALLNVEDVLSGRPSRYSMKLTKQSQPGGSTGSLLISLSCLDEDQRMSVDVDQARNLCFSHIGKGSRSSDKVGTYVKVTLYCAGEKIKSKKSALVVGDSCPHYGFNTSFKVVPNYLDDCYIVVSVLYKGTLRKDTSLGRYILGPQFFSQGQQITPWGRVVLRREGVTYWFRLYQ